jgi:hypothetical protein
VLFLVVAAFCLLTVPLARGRLGALGDVEPRGVGAAVLGLAIQVVIISIIPTGDHTFHTTAHLGSYVLVFWVVWANRRVAWLWLVGLGGFLNFVAISANGGVMPASAEAIATAGTLPEKGEFINSTVLEDPNLLFLGDVFAIPAPWTHNVFSVGDVVMAVGAFLCVHTICGSVFSTRRLMRVVRAQPSGRAR